MDGVTEEEMAESQREDIHLSKAIKWLEQGYRPAWSEMKEKGKLMRSLWHEWPHLLLHGKLLCHRSEQEVDQVPK